MPLSDSLIQFLRDVVKGLGEFGPKYATPLQAFLSMRDEPEKIQGVLQRGLTIESVSARLEKILSEDLFLAQCCGDGQRLAHALDILFFSRLSGATYTDSVPSFDFIPSPFDLGIDELERSLYGQGAFTKAAYFHLFNFSASPENYPSAPYPGWRFEELEIRSIAQILGESSWFSFLSPPSSGTIFLVVQDSEGFNSESMNDWLTRRWGDISPYRQVLQYSKDAIVAIDYVVPYFTPSWVNNIQRGGLFYWGTPRQDGSATNLRYRLLPWDSEQIQLLWLAYQRHADKFKSHGTSLRKAIRIAGNFFEDCHKKISRIEQFADLMIALEALYTPSDTAEHTFRISQSCALMVEGSLEAREATFEFIRSMFKRRNKLFHGQYDMSSQTPQDFITDQEIKELLSIVRRSTLKFLALYLRGEQNLDKVRKDLEKAILDETFRVGFLEKTDYESLLTEEVN